MTYTLNVSKSSISTITIQNGALDNSTSLTLVGKNYPSYGSILEQNLINMLQNFAYDTQPVNPITGQLWFNTSSGSLQVFNGSIFKRIGGATVSSTAPTATSVIGDLWYKDSDAQLFVYNGSGTWVLVGPSYTTAQQITTATALTITDNGSANHTVLAYYVGGLLTGILSKDPTFTPAVPISGFVTINPGYNINTNLFTGQIPLIGQLITNAQPYVNSLGTLTGLTVSSPIVGSVLYNANTVVYPIQSNITSLGTLTSVTVSGSANVGSLGILGSMAATNASLSANVNAVNINATNAVNVPTVSATNLTGTLTTAAQTAVTSLGTLTGLTVSGTTNLQNVTNGYVINATDLYASVIGNTGSAFYGATATFTGTVSAQNFVINGGTITLPNTNAGNTTASSVTSVSITGGNITGSVIGNVGSTVTGTQATFSNITGAVIGNAGTALVGTLVTNAQPFVTSLGSLSTLSVLGAVNITGTTNISATINTNQINASAVQAGSIGNSGATITGNIQTAAQPNITSLGKLSSLAVTGNISSDTGMVSPYFYGTLIGPAVMTGGVMDNMTINKRIIEKVSSLGSVSGSVTIDLSSADIFTMTMASNITLSFSNAPTSGYVQTFTLVLKQDGTGSRTVTYPSSVRFSFGQAPVLTTTANYTDVLTFVTYDGGSTYYGAYSMASLAP